MQRRYRVPRSTSPGSFSGIMISSVTIISTTGSTVTEKSFITGGPAGGTVVIKVTSLGGTGTGGQYFNLNGSNQVLNQTTTLTLDSSGNANYTTITYSGSVSGGLISAVVSINSVSGGSIGSPSTRSYHATT